MSNYFLKVDKDFFKLGLNPIEILLLSQIVEFNNNTGVCFMSDDVLATNFGVSAKTISRSLKSLEDKGFINRETKNIKGGKERILTVNENTINAALTTDNLSIVNDEKESLQQTICPLTTDNLSIDKGQNDLIKDNIRENIIDKGEKFIF